jgi:hypothetical protein
MLAVFACLGTSGDLEVWKESGGMEEGAVSSERYGGVLTVRSEGRQQDERKTDPGE